MLDPFVHYCRDDIYCIVFVMSHGFYAQTPPLPHKEYSLQHAVNHDYRHRRTYNIRLSDYRNSSKRIYVNNLVTFIISTTLN